MNRSLDAFVITWNASYFLQVGHTFSKLQNLARAGAKYGGML
jgi:hypothetical protein